MIRIDTVRQRARFTVLIAALLLGAPVLTSMAQGDGLNLIETAEYDIGVECPVASTLDAAGTTLWVLMNNCGQRNFVLRAYNVADGSQVNEDDYADVLMSLAGPDFYVDPFI